MSVLYGKVRVNAKNRLPYDSTIRTFPYSGYGTVMYRDNETGILTLNGTSESGRLYYLTSKSGAWLPTNNYVGMKLKCYGTNLNNFYANVRYFNSSTDTEFVKQVNVKSNEYTIENYPYFVISTDYNGNVTFNNDSLEIILYDAQIQIAVTSALGITKTVNIPTGASYVDIPLAGLEEYTLTTNSDSETVLLNYGGFKEVALAAGPPYYKKLKDGQTLTEAEWLAFLNGGGIKFIIDKGETSIFLGKKVSLTNSADSTYTTWSIGDFNHDSTSNTCDLILDNTIHRATFGSDGTYSGSAARTWLTGTYYNGFSVDIKNKLQTMSVASNGSRLDDKIKLLSIYEVGITSAHVDSGRSYYQEGTRYPIFPVGGTGDYEINSDRVRTGAASYWWLRTRYQNGFVNYVWNVRSDGSLYYAACTDTTHGLVPAIRFTN